MERNLFMTPSALYSPAPRSMPVTQRHQQAAKAVLIWYSQNRRSLPWRAALGEAADPYHVWLSEIMLQQTTVATVSAYFQKFIRLWPKIEDLARANRDDVMAAWAGLGYYARARNLHATAIAVTADYGGVFPSSEAELRQFPGIGAYTAAAIVAIGFGQRAVVVDGNIERVTARWAAIKTPLPRAKPELYAVMDALTPAADSGSDRGHQGGYCAGDFAQAMMDLGAMVCTPPRRIKDGLSPPLCTICPLQKTCKATGHGAEHYPFKKPKMPRPDRLGIVAVIEDSGGHVALERRPDHGMLGGLDVFPGSGWADGSSTRTDYPLMEDSLVGQVMASMTDDKGHILNAKTEHIFTHFRVVLTIHRMNLAGVKPDLPSGLTWVAVAQLSDIALPTVMVKVAKTAGLMT
jgi:A/G-specific adenine glycosylase